MVPGQYFPSGDHFQWIKCFAALVVPGEAIRFVACFSSLGHINATGLLAILPSVLFENTYLVWSGRSNAVRNLLEYKAADFVVYALYYLIYVAVYLVITGWIYRYFWFKGKEERDDLIVRENKIKYY